MLPQKDWQPEWVARLLLAILLSVSIGAVISEWAWQWEAVRGLGSKAFMSVITGTIFLHGVTFGVVHWLLRHHGIGWREGFGLKGPGWLKAVGWAVLATIVVLPLARALGVGIAEGMEWLGFHPEEQETVQALRSTAALWQVVFFGAVAIAIAPVSEELIFRGVLYPTVKEMGFPKTAVWGNSLVFGLIHANLVSLVPLMLLSVVWTLLYERTGNLAAPIVAHALFNAVNFFSLIHMMPLD